MTRNDKIAFAIGAMLSKKLHMQVAVCRIRNTVEWRTPYGGYAVMDVETISPKEVLGMALKYLGGRAMKLGK